jgi:uncharacterized membrane protein YfcA
MSDAIEAFAGPAGWGGPAGFALLAAVAFLAAAVNSVAGGGTILTFPVLAAILPADPARLVTANATSTIGLWPGAIAAAWAYRGERVGQPPWARWLLVPSVVGAIAGALLVVALPPALFDALVPWLILTAAILFAAQPYLVHTGRGAVADAASSSRLGEASIPLACGLQFLVALYGG